MESIKCVKDVVVGVSKKRTFIKNRIYTVLTYKDENGQINFSAQDIRGKMKNLFSTENPTVGLNFLREHFDLSGAPTFEKTLPRER